MESLVTLGITGTERIANKQTDRQTDRQTDILLYIYIDRLSIMFMIFVIIQTNTQSLSRLMSLFSKDEIRITVSYTHPPTLTPQQRMWQAIEPQFQQQQPFPPRKTYKPSPTWSEMFLEHEQWLSLGYDDYVENNLTPALEAYNREKMDPKARWDQEQMNQLQELSLLEQETLMSNKS